MFVKNPACNARELEYISKAQSLIFYLSRQPADVWGTMSALLDIIWSKCNKNIRLIHKASPKALKGLPCEDIKLDQKVGRDLWSKVGRELLRSRPLPGLATYYRRTPKSYSGLTQQPNAKTGWILY
jgi:hypothetical protein